MFIEGHLKLDTWTDKPENGGGKRSALRVVVENFQYLEPRADGAPGMGDPSTRVARPAQPAAARTAAAPARNGGANYGGDFDDSDMGSAPGRPVGGNTDDDIPF